jgi:DNA-binding transcriptional MocR family regulator
MLLPIAPTNATLNANCSQNRANHSEMALSGSVRGAQLARLLGGWLSCGQANRRAPEYALLAAAVRSLLIDGRLALGVRLPAERDLAQALHISRTTVTAAYRTLRESGHLTSRRGAGSWTALPPGHRVATTGLWAPEEDGVIDLSVAALAAPAELTEAAREAVGDLSAYTSGAGYEPMGLPVLRAAVAAVYTARGVTTHPDQIMITNGVQHALDLLLRLLVSPGQPVLVESPSYPNALVALAARRARVVTHNLAETGWDEELLLAGLRAARPRLAYLIPEYQNPTGYLMPGALRERLAATAHVAGTDLIVDESFVDLALDGDGDWDRDGGHEAQPPVAAFDRHARVLSIGGMSKPYWGGLRVGWIRAAAPVVARLAAVRVGVDMASPVLEQLIAVRLLARAERVVRARRTQLRARRDTLAAALRTELPGWRFTLPTGGVCLWVELDAPVASALARAVEDLGVRLTPGPRFGVDGTMERFMRLPFTLPECDLVEAVRRLAEARQAIDRPSARSWATTAVVA